MQTIRAIRNTSIPVNRLPPEILSRVLEFRTPEWDLVTATHVCQYWRSTLTSTPSLWSCFQFQSSHDLDRTLTYLERSKSALIDLSINIDSPRDSEVLNCIAPHIARTRSLIIRGSHDVHTASLLFCNPAPSLQNLEIHTFEGFVRLPDNFLGQQAPSLRSVSFSGICPTFESPFPLPNLTELYLYMPEGTGPLRMSGLFRFLSDSPLLQRICINIPSQTVQDVSLDQVVSLESLVELSYTCNSAGRVLSCLRLPHLKQFRVSSSLGQMQKLADILPRDGRALLTGATEMLYYCNQYSLRVDLSGKGVDVSFIAFPTTADDPSVDWFSDQMYIPFGQIEDLKVEACSIVADPPINFFALGNLRVLRVVLGDGLFADGFLRLLHPDPGTGVPCRSLRELECTYWGSPGPLSGVLISLVRERKRAGHQLRLVRLYAAQEFDQHLVEELREHVEEVEAGM